MTSFHLNHDQHCIFARADGSLPPLARDKETKMPVALAVSPTGTDRGKYLECVTRVEFRYNDPVEDGRLASCVSTPDTFM